ncbi:MAG TPA: hypothetical protein VJT31_35170, partial [Rugosimonospora sp.]|nr:hypothetical protein [Rugosimonospora sp.]
MPSLDVTLAYVRACGGDVAVWERRWRAVAAELVVAADDGTSEAASPGDSARGDGAGDGARAPYVGLAPFQPTDVDRFFGREDLVADLMRRVRRHRFVAVVGASGSGKSSVLRAGLIPAWTALSGAPPIIMFTPGPAPFEECALKLAALGGVDPPDVHRRLNGDRLGLHWVVRQVLDERAGDADLLIVVDQFEELFTLCAEAGDRDRFIAALLAAAAAASSRCRVVIGTRADFYAHCVAYPGLVDAFNEAHLAVGAMTMDELRRAVTQPALQHHLTLESALLAELVATAYGRVGVLPLLSHALRETWRRRRGNTLTLAGFRATGGIDGALTNTAESVYQALGSDRQQVARDLFSRLCALGDGTHDTKRRIRRDDLDLSDEDVRAVVEHFVAARLITVGQDWTEITHEILISSWPRLRQWLTADRDVLRLHQELTEASRQWEDIGRDPAALLRGVRLAAANEWTAAGRAALAPREHAFLAASNTLQEAERVAARRQRRRLRSLVAALTVLLVMVSGAMTAAILARRAAAHQRDVATAQNVAVAAAGLRATQPALATQLLLAAYRLAPTTPVRSALLGAFAQPYATVLT